MKSILNRSNVCQLLHDSNVLSQEKIALEFDNHSLTYSELRTITNQRADLLCKKYKVNAGDAVGIYLDCKFNAILWIIAILKAGGTYVALDNKWPELRINQAVKLANLELLITYGAHIKHFKQTFKLLNCIDYNESCTSYDENFLISDIEKSTLAYIVFTSGSTGIPKGVTMSHRALLHYLDWEWSQHIEQLHTDIRVLQFFPLSFDISFQEFLTTLVLDGTVIIAPDSIKNDMHEFVKFIDKMSINKLYIPYVFLVELAEYCHEANKYPQSIHQIISSGEKLLLTQKIKNLFIHMPNCKLINLYGASEIQVVSVYEMQAFPGLWSDIGLIGRPIKHVSIYLLDENKQIVNGNAIGEIHIESECLTSGYLTDDLLAKKKFVVLEIDGHTKKLYTTGDLARYVDDGNIEYIGRRDFQVKIRGHRVELGEVDRALLGHALVQQAVTLAVDDAKQLTKLISYIVLDGYLSSLKKNPDVILDLTEKIEFKIAQHNIRKFSELNTIKLDESILSDDVKDVYFRRKSYRNYQNIEIDDANFKGLFRHLSEESFQFNENEHQPSFFSRVLLDELLALLASIQPDKQILPKYRYPSAGSLYPVQIYLEIGAGITDIPPGHYYYNPEQHALQMTDNKPTTGGGKLYFVGNLSSIEPLYGDLSEKFCLIELGYMLGLIKSQFQSQGLTLSSLGNCNHSLLSENLRLHNKDIFLGGYELIATHQEKVQRVQPEVFIYIKGKISQYNLGWYKYDIEGQGLTYINNTESFNLSIVADKNYPIFNQAAFAIFFISKNSEKNSLELLFTETGMLAQSLMQHAPNYHIGLCPIGMIDSNSNKTLETITNGFFIHAMFGGPIEPSQMKDHGQSQARSIESIMTEVLKHYLSNKLPDYMQPAQMVFLDGMPLTFNGKIDRRALPQSELVKEHIYAAARNDVERELIKVWSDVLQCDEDKLGIRDDFFWLGGNSITSIQLTSKLKQKFGVTLSFKDIFTYKTIERLYDNVMLPHSLIHDESDIVPMEDYTKAIPGSDVINQDYLDRIQADGAVEAVYLANSLQQGFIYHAITQGEIDDAYIVQRVWEYTTSLDLEKLKLSWLLALQKYQSLRLRFAWQEELVQVVDTLGVLDWRYIEVTGKFDDIEQHKLRIQHILTQDRLERYNLEQGKLFRVYIIKQHDSLYTCLFSHHHAILDGWSNSIVFNFIHNTYLQLLDKKNVSIIYDHTYKQTQQYLQAHREVHSNYWNEYISQIEEKADLQGLILDKNIKLINYKHIKNSQEENLNIEGDLYRQLKLFSQTEGVTVNSILQYIWHKILHLYGNSKHTVVGTVISGRSLPIDGIEDSVGLYINTLPLIVDHDKQDKQMIIKAINAIQDNIGEMNERSGIELSTLQKDGRRLFDVLFICDNYPEPKIDDDRAGRLKVNLTAAIEKLDYPLVFIVYELDDKLACTIKYAGELFRDSVIKQLLSLVSGLLAQITIKSQQMLTRDLRYLTTIDEAYRTIHQWNATDIYYPQFKTFLQLFEEQAEKYADKIAVVYGDTKITYRELDAQSSQLACRLQLAGIQRNDLVGIYLERSHLTIIGIIGIIKSGGAYTPIDTLYPNNRVNYILQDAQLKFILTSVDLAKNLSMDLTVIFLEGLETTCKDMRESFIQRCPLDTIYSLYTSGSTGLPKASSIHHSGFINLLHWYINSYKISETDKVLIISSICFDLTQKNILGLLLSGGEVHLLHSKHYDSTKINTVINEQSITILNCTPSAFYGLLDESLPRIKLRTLKKVFLGGEPINTLRFKGIRENSLNFQIINTYGPTECSDITSAYDLTETDINNNCIIPIGKPIHNVQVYILNRHMELLPSGAIGELYIGGVSVSLGYLNKPGLTAEKFIPNLFQSEQERLENRNFRLYKTGDLARWMPDGNIEFLGRIDFQIKIRGFRIELGEIESTIQSIVGVKESVVLMREDVEHQKRLVLYIVLENKAIKSVIETAKQEIDRKKKMVMLCREICQSSLPDYMQPSQIIVLDNFPLTPNGKIDRKAFPVPENIAEKKLETNELPVGLFETQLADVWKDIFKVDPIGRNDNFFYLGGDSIISIQMVARARQKGILLTVNQVFKTPTVAGLIAEFQSSKRLFNEEKSMLTGTTAPLLPIQQWFFEKADNIHHFNQAHWFVVKKAEIEEECRIDVTRLKNAIEELCEYHDAFRLKYKQKDGYWEQYYSDYTGISLEVIKESSWAEETLEILCSEIQSSLDIERGPLSRVVWFEGKGLFWVIHHLIVDGVSWRILIEDLNTLYEGHCLGLKGHSYKTWGTYLQGYDNLESTKAYYSNKPKTGLCLKAVSPRTRHKINFSAETSKSFIQKAHKAYNTQANDLLLTALVQAMGAYSNYQLCIDMEGHGREMLGSDLDLTRTVGWFTTVFPVYLTLSEPMNLDTSIKEIKEQLRQVPEKGITYGLASYIQKQIPEILSANISFNYLGQWDTADASGHTFKLGNEGVGCCLKDNNRLFHDLDILGQVKDGVLSFEWESNYEASLIRELVNNFKQRLEALILHCSTEGVYGYTPSDFDLIKLPQHQLNHIVHIQLDDIYPLSPIQSGLLFQKLYDLESDAYFIQSIFELNNLNVCKWQAAWNAVVNRHDSLKAGFFWVGLDEPVQLIHKKVELLWAEEHWIQKDDTDLPIEEKLQKLLYDERRKGFDVSKAPLMRFNLIQIENNKYYFVWNMHHLLTDGWSGSIILNDVIDIYNNNHGVHSNTRKPFKGYMSWLLKQDQISAQRYWESYLSGVTPTVLEGDASLIEDEIYRDYTLVLNAEETNKLNQYAKSIEVTTNTILQGVWGILLSKYTRHDDVVFGMVVSGRSIALPGIEDMVGVFINTLPTRIQLKPSDTIKKFMQLLQVQMSATQEHGYISLSSIQSMQNERTLFDTIFAFENYPISYESQDDLSISLINVIEKTEYKLSIAVVPTNEIEIKINYNTRYFTENYINKLSKNLYYLLLNIVQNTYQFIGNVSLIDSNELTQRGQWNNTVANYPSTKSVHELFEDISAVNKDEIAVIYKDTQWTYEVLNQTANQLAHYLRKNQVTTETLVGICAPRGFDLITGFLAILKSGGVYLPLDPEYPIDRLEYMLEDTGVKILLTTVNLKDKFKGFKGKIIFFDHREYGDESIDNLNTKVLPDNLAYVIYTSGSTGKSKGVTIKHRSLINNILWHANELNITNARVLQRASSSFDASIWEMVLPLINAHSLIIFPENGEMQSDDLNDFIEKYRCNVVQMTPSLTEIFRLNNNTCIEKLVVGGEALTLDHVSIIKNNLPNASLYNVYGVTESCIDASYCLVGGNKGVVTVGKPLCNMQIHILDQHLNPVPIGCIGEIYIGGIGLARGYLNRPGLTAEKFLPNPFINMEETRIYKTGDLGRYFEDGDIEYLGRIDHQVKIRGFRVELGEIESIIQSIAEIEQCIVTMREEKKGQQILVAYIILDRTQNFVNEVQKIEIINKCRETCKAKLPDHMQPNHIMLLEKIPLTPNEKVDRNALPKPGNREDLSQYEPPSNEQEQLICEAFGKVLKLEKIGVHDDFFLLGGNSILAIYLVVALQANFNIQIKDIFEHRTPRTLALFSRLDKCALINNLERIKLLYKTVIGDNHASEKWAQVKENTYLESIKNLQNDSFYNLRKPILNVLLTGATGFLGCNLLNQLLNLTDYRIFLLVRADSQHDAMARVNNKFQFYFNKTLDANYLSRVVVINADIEKEKFGLIQDQYDILVNQIDSVIHAAALVKHYGEWDAFYASNVQATINLLELTRLTKHRDFHYISTCSVLNNGFISNSEGYIYTEDDLPKDLNVTDNVYVQTKLLGEREVVRYRDFNLKTTIYRVGNLAFMSENSRTQENIKDNAFSSWIKYFLHEKISTNNMEKMEISPVDHTACAIIKLFDKKNLDNATYHLFNPHLCDVSEAFNQCKTIKFSNVSMEHFIDNIIQGLNNNSDCDLIVKFLLHQGWLDDRCFKASSPTKVLQEKTNSILKRLQFDWLPIKQESFDKYLKQLVTHR